MIRYYQELLNECIDIQEHKKVLNIMQAMKIVMQNNKKSKEMEG